MNNHTKKPDWLKIKIPSGSTYTRLKKIIKNNNLHTVCLEARCPNQGECFCNGTATFLILGNTCTRNCHYCSVTKGTPIETNIIEPKKIANAVKELNLKYAVITSVTRDDLADGGAALFAQTVSEIKKTSPDCKVEVLIPDFKSDYKTALDKLFKAKPSVINHNIEVVRKYYSALRPLGNYDLSLSILRYINENNYTAKSGLMVGFGENLEDIKATFDDLLKNGCSILTVGQYLQSSKANYPVTKYYNPDEFEEIKEIALKMGFSKVMSGALVRSSYHAEFLS